VHGVIAKPSADGIGPAACFVGIWLTAKSRRKSENTLDHGRRAVGSHWCLQDLNFASIDIARTRERDDIFALVCSASLIESGSDLYTHNLVRYFAKDAEVCDWLQDHWEPEELQHGQALKAYVQHVWPEFDWNSAYADFLKQYSKLCTAENLEPTRGQELAARCVVEMGTTTYYQALNSVCDEPVLRGLAWRIRNDELQHYGRFYRYFLKYQSQEPVSRSLVVAALWRRLAELRQSDTEIALRCAADWRFGERKAPPSFDAIRKQALGLVRVQYPIKLAMRMTLKPLQLNPRFQRWTERPIAAIVSRIMLS
jgi:hypothetical protein